MILRKFDFARIASLTLLACVGFAGQATGQPATPAICNEVLTVTDYEGGHILKDQQFLFVGPISPQNYMTVTALHNGTTETVGPGDHPATWLSGDINQAPAKQSDGSVQNPWIYEWAAPVSTENHQPVRVHLFAMKVVAAKSLRGRLCPSEVEFWGKCHPEEDCTHKDPGHATAN